MYPCSRSRCQLYKYQLAVTQILLYITDMNKDTDKVSMDGGSSKKEEKPDKVSMDGGSSKEKEEKPVIKEKDRDKVKSRSNSVRSDSLLVAMKSQPKATKSLDPAIQKEIVSAVTR